MEALLQAFGRALACGGLQMCWNVGWVYQGLFFVFKSWEKLLFGG